MFEFLTQHKKLYEIKSIDCDLKDEVLFSLDINDLENGENMLKMEDVVKIVEETEKNPETELSYNIDQVEAEIIKTLKYKLGKSVITNEDISQFLENHFLVDKDYLGTEFSNYKELEAYINSRVDSYCKSKVSTSHIENISFHFQGSIKDFEDEKSCGVCLEDYREDQEVCRLPCNHFCCRNCTGKMFAVPQNGSKAHFECPICRADCT